MSMVSSTESPIRSPHKIPAFLYLWPWLSLSISVVHANLTATFLWGYEWLYQKPLVAIDQYQYFQSLMNCKPMYEYQGWGRWIQLTLLDKGRLKPSTSQGRTKRNSHWLKKNFHRWNFVAKILCPPMFQECKTIIITKFKKIIKTIMI